MVAVWALCADTEEEARRLAASAKMMFTLFFRGTLIPIPPVEKALEFLAAENASAPPPAARRRTIVGTPDQVREGIGRVASEYAADEVMVVTITFDYAARRRSYELIAEAFALT